MSKKFNKNSFFNRIYYNILKKKEEKEEKEKKKKEEVSFFGRKLTNSRTDKGLKENQKNFEKVNKDKEDILVLNNSERKKNNDKERQISSSLLSNKQNDDTNAKKNEPKAEKNLTEKSPTNSEVTTKAHTQDIEEKEKSKTITTDTTIVPEGCIQDYIGQVILEESILKYLEDVLKENDYKIKKLLVDYQKYKQEADNLLKYDKGIEVLQQIEVLNERIAKIKFELESLKNSVNFNGDFSIDKNYIMYLMDEYRKIYNTELTIMEHAQIKDENEYNSIMKQLYEIDNTTLMLQEEVQKKLIGIEERDKEFDEFTIKLDENDKTFADIEYLLKNTDYYLKDLEDKVNNSVNVIEQVKYVTMRSNTFLNSLLLGYALAKKNPNYSTTIKALALTSLTINSISNFINPRVEMRTRRTIEVIDYEKEIIEGLKSVDDIFALMDETMEKIVDLREVFVKQFKNYDIPEYKEALNKLDELSSEISKRRDYLSFTKKEFDAQLSKNGIKVKKLNYNPYDEEKNEVEDIA